jgi:U3 small nucleolar RNA-associated protein 20
MMVSCVTRSTRTMCAQIFVQFLLEYPLEAGRVEQHINYLLKNLGYFDPEGRL